MLKIDFQLAKFNDPQRGTREIISTWPKLTDAMIKHPQFGKHVSRCEKIAKSLLKTEQGLMENGVASGRKIIEYVKSSYSWNGLSAKLAVQSPKQFITSKSGNAAEINLFLVAMLKAAGIEAEPVIISTRSHGKVKTDYPFHHFFNYVIALVKEGGNLYLADGTDLYSRFDRTPIRCINDKGLVITDGETKWIDTYNKIQSVNKKVITIDPDPESLENNLELSLQTTEYESLRLKHTFEDNQDEIKEYLHRKGFSEISTLKTLHFEKSEVPYVIAAKGKNKMESIDGKILIKPFIDFIFDENPLKQKERTYPVDLVISSSDFFETIIKLPEGYQLLEKPSNVSISNELVKIILTIETSNNTILAKGEITFKQPIYDPKHYERIKSYFGTISNRFNEPIVLEPH